MKVVKIRRVGNSNVVSLPRELEERGYAPGTEVVVDELPSGEVLLQPVARLRQRVRAVGRQAIEENREALEILEAYDRGEAIKRSGKTE